MTVSCEECQFKEICEKHPHNPCLMDDNDDVEGEE